MTRLLPVTPAHCPGLTAGAAVRAGRRLVTSAL
jgi:hypothetical protein